MTGPNRYINYSSNNGGIVPLWLNTFISDPIKTLLLRLGLDVQAAGSYPIIPTVIDWPLTVDQNGVAFPAGIVGVLHSYDYTLSEADNFQGNTSTHLIAVPDTLNTGSYSPRWQRDHRNKAPELGTPYTFAGLYGQASPADLFGPTTYALTRDYSIRTPQALTPYPWMPENSGDWGADIISITPGFAQTGFALTGFRYIRVIGTNDNAVATDLKIIRNGTPDVTLYTQSIPPGPYDTGVLFHNGTTQDWYAPLGDKRFFTVQTPDVLHNPVIAAGPRLDIPLPYLATGPNHVIPGGVWIGAGIPGYA